MSITIIAEAGVNHNGDLNKALKMIEIAASAKADYIKFQTFTAKNLVTKNTPKAPYQKNNTNDSIDTQFEMLKKLEIDLTDYPKIIGHCKKHNIKFLSTAFDIASAEFLINECHLDIIKIGSGDLTNYPLIFAIAKSGIKIILSTGMANITEIKHALSIIGLGYLIAAGKTEDKAPNITKLDEYYKTSHHILKEKLSLLHCVTEYPAPIEIANISAISHLSQEFNLNIGYSDHTIGSIASILSLGYGASIIEKHFTLDKNLPGPDHKASLNPEELYLFVQTIRDAKNAIGTGKKIVQEAEKKNITAARKSIIATKPIKKGEFFSEKNITVKRPGNGLDPLYFWKILQQKAKQNYITDELINFSEND